MSGWLALESVDGPLDCSRRIERPLEFPSNRPSYGWCQLWPNPVSGLTDNPASTWFFRTQLRDDRSEADAESIHSDTRPWAPAASHTSDADIAVFASALRNLHHRRTPLKSQLTFLLTTHPPTLSSLLLPAHRIMRGNLFGIAENTSTKPTTTSKQATTTRATTRSKQAANTPPPNEKQQANGGRSRNRGRGRGRGGGGEHAVLQTQPRQPVSVVRAQLTPD